MYTDYINEIKSLNNFIISLEDIKSTENIDNKEDSIFIVGVSLDKVSNPEPLKPEPLKPEPPNPEPPKPEPPKQEPLKQEPPKQEPPKPEPLKQERPKSIQGGLFLPYKFQVPIGTIIQAPKLLTSRFRGGSTHININKVIELLNIKSKLAELVKYIYVTYGKLLSMDDIIEVLVVLKYSEFTDIPIQDISTIPPEFKYNFTDLVKRDINNPELIKNYNTNIENINKLVNPIQSGGKPEDKTVEEKINDNVRRLSDYLKKHKKQTNQKGGNSLDDLINIVTNEISNYPTNINEQKKKEKELEVKCNNWAQELIGMNVVYKIIKDNEYGIARFYLKSNDINLTTVLDFINSHASILTFNSKAPYKFANPIAPLQTLGNDVKPFYISDKLKKYFENRYKNLKLIKDALYISIDDEKETPVTYEELNKPREKKPTKEIIDQFRALMNIQYGGEDQIEIKNIYTNKITCIEDCFISRQYKKFQQMIINYFKTQDLELAKSEVESLDKDIKVLMELEDKLVNMKEIFNNYKKIQDNFPQKIESPITFDHIKKLLKDNKFLIDDYGKINQEAIDNVKLLEKYLIVQDELEDTYRQPTMQKELTNIIQSKPKLAPLLVAQHPSIKTDPPRIQAGGNSNITNKFTVFQEQEYFTTDTFKKVLKQIS